MKLLLCILLFQMSAFAMNAEEDSRLIKTKDKTALDLERVVVEQNIKSKILGVVVPLIPKERFNLNVAINYKIIKPKKESQVQDESANSITLGKLGVVAPSVSDELLHNDLVSNIGYIRITFIFYEHVPAEKIQVLTAAIKKVVDIVPIWRLKIETVVPAAPVVVPPTMSEKVENITTETYVGIFGLGLAMLLIYMFSGLRGEVRNLREALKNMAFKSQRNEETHKHESHAHQETYAPREAAAHHQDVYEAQWETVTPERDIKEANVEFTSEPVEPVAKHEHVSEPVIHAKVANVANVEEALQLLADSTPANENEIFESFVSKGQFDELALVAHKFYPACLVMELPEHILARGLAMTDIQDKVSLLLSMSEDNRNTLVKLLGTKEHHFLEHELIRYHADPSVKRKVNAEAAAHFGTFVNVVRDLLRTNQLLANHAEPLLTEWIQKKAKGARSAA